MLILKLAYRITGFIRLTLYKCLFGNAIEFASYPKLRKGFSLMIEPGGRVSIGKNCFFNNYCSISCVESVEIEEDCIFGEGVRCYDHNHRFRDTSVHIYEQGYKSAPIRIGRDCWIGSNVVILKGTQIGESCVIGAGCVLSGTIPAFSIVTQDRSIIVNPRQEIAPI